MKPASRISDWAHLTFWTLGTRRLNLDVNNITDSAKRAYQGDPSNPTSVRYYDWAANFRVGWSL